MPGPAFPTVQLFNAGAGGGDGQKRKRAVVNLDNKTGGPLCQHLPHGAAASQPPPPAASSSAADGKLRAIGKARSGSPPCVPSLDFSHPTKPERMALPTVPELVRRLLRKSRRSCGALSLTSLAAASRAPPAILPAGSVACAPLQLPL
jgi:hypothetical protein